MNANANHPIGPEARPAIPAPIPVTFEIFLDVLYSPLNPENAEILKFLNYF